MTPAEALAMIDEVLAQVQVNRAAQIQLQQAVSVLAEAIRRPNAQATDESEAQGHA